MTSAEKVYQKYLIKVEGNITNDNIATDRGKFVILYNEGQNKYTEWLLDKRGEDDIKYIQTLLVKDRKIVSDNFTENYFNFSLPKDYFDFVNVYANCSQGTCKNVKVDLFDLEGESENEIMQDEHNCPSFLWREAPFIISSDSIKVLYLDFSVEEIILTFYRYPKQIALLDPNDPESQFDNSISLDFDNKVIDRIVSLIAGEFELNNENPFFQQQKQRVASKL